MLTPEQIEDVWEGRISAEVRALYFGDLASHFSLQKQWITSLTFFLSSGAAATLIAKMPLWFPILLSTIVAIITAYSVAVNLDSKIRTMAKLHFAWNQIEIDFARLWNHTYSDAAEFDLYDIQRRVSEVSELATTDAPYDQKRLLRWQDRDLKQYRLEAA
jgi:hypothetical protein